MCEDKELDNAKPEDYIATVAKMYEELDKNTLEHEKVLSKDVFYRLRIQISPYKQFRINTKTKKWYVRLYRKLFPTRSYLNWRVKQYFLRKLTKKFRFKVDQWLAYGDTIKKEGITTNEL